MTRRSPPAAPDQFEPFRAAPASVSSRRKQLFGLIEVDDRQCVPTPAVRDPYAGARNQMFVRLKCSPVRPAKMTEPRDTNLDAGSNQRRMVFCSASLFRHLLNRDDRKKCVMNPPKWIR
jgi:hypothetical protein